MDGMMAGMKTQMVMMVPQMVIMGWINFFFQGFVLSAYASLRISSYPCAFSYVTVSSSQASISTHSRI